MIKRFLIPALLLACAAGTARAATVTFTTTTVGQADVPFSDMLSLQKFNTDLGTLTGVTLTVTEISTATVQIFNPHNTALPFTNASASIPLTATGPDGSSATATAVTTIASGTAAAGTTSNFMGSQMTVSNSTMVPMSSWVPNYEGSGSQTFNLTFAAGAGTFGGTGTGLFFGGTATAGGFVSVTYTYTPFAVPEPASMALLGIGMAGLLSFRRLFKRKAVA